MGTRFRRFGTAAFAVVLLSQGLPIAVLAATIQTDLFVYQNGDTVTVTGDGFGATETVDVVTTDPAATVVDQGTVTTDGQGNLIYLFTLNATISGLYDVIATGETSGLEASTQFDPQDKTSLDLSFTSPGLYGTALVTSGLLTDDATSPSTPLGGATVNLATYSSASCGPGQFLRTLGTPITGSTGANAGRYTFNAFQPVGSFFVQATYDGDANHMKSQSSCLPLTVNLAATITSAVPSVNSITPGGQAVISWTVSSNKGATNNTATGTTTLVKDSGPGTLTCSPASVSVSAAQTTGSGFSFTAATSQKFACSASVLGSYSYHIHFVDSDGNYTGSDSGVIGLNVVSASNLVVQSASGTYGGTVSLQATLTSGGSGVSGKSISFSLNGTSLGSATTTSAGVATLSSASLAGINAGTYPIGVNAAFAGDLSLAAASASAQLVVGAKTVSATVTADSRAYDGTTITAVATCSLTGVIGSDNVTCDFSTASANFSDRNVGTGKSVTVTGLKLAGTAAGNYSLSFTSATTTANITATGVTVNFTPSSKVYDATANASITGCTLAGVVAPDVVSCVSSGATANFTNKNVGTSKTVTGGGFMLSGADAGNYSITTINTSTANISQRDLPVTATGINKQYDGTTAAGATLSTNKIAGDSVTANYASASFADKNVGTAKTVSVSGITISGADAGNYHVTNTTASTTANITISSVVVNFTAQSRTYDGSNVAAITGCTLSGAVAGDDVSCDRSAVSAAFSDKNVGTGKAVTGAGFALSGADAPNYSFTVNTATANITKRDLHVTAAGANKIYDANTTAVVTLSADKVSFDNVTASYSTAAFADKNIGTGKTVTVTGISVSGVDSGNYNLTNTTATATANITKRDLTVSAAGVDKVYDGGTTATVTLSTDSFSGDAVTAAYASASFANKNVGTAKAVALSGISISGADAGNYHLTSTTAATSAAITARDLHVSATGVNKVYDRTTAADVSLADDAVAGDDVTPGYRSAAFGDKNVGTAKTVSVSGISISGGDAINYHLVNTTASTSADITHRDLTAAATGVNKIYDGNTNATVGLTTDSLAGDYVVASSTSASYADKNVGTGKAVSVSGITIWGGDAANYHLLNTTAATTADITARDLTVTAHGIGKTYDATRDATVTLSTDAVPGDDLTPYYTDASFADKNVGSGKAVSVAGISISGADAGNYHLVNTTAATTANITQRDLTVSAAGVGKVYDGNTTAAVTLSSDKVIGDDLTPAYASASFNNRNVGSGKPVSVAGISISGADATNYSLTNTTASTTASISFLGVEIYFTADNRTYDGTVGATVHTCSVVGLSGDDLSCDKSGATATFADKNVGDGKTVTGTGFALTGADAGNYSAHLNTTLANISPRDLHVSAHGVNRTYDATTAADVSLADDAVAGDDVTPGYRSAAFGDKNVGTAKTVSVSGISISGGDAINYHLVNTTASTSADITHRDLTAAATGVNKIYDGNTNATVGLTTDSLAGDYVVASSTSASYADKNVGTGKAVSVSGITIWGGDAANYHLLNTTAATTADITARDLTVSAAGVDKVYEGNTTAAVTLSSDKVTGDTVTAAYTTATFDTRNVGSGKAVSVSGISISGADAGNYYLTNTTAATTAAITARDLHVTAVGVSKVYDGNSTATVILSTDKVTGDSVSASYVVASFADRNVGTAKPVSVSGISISGTDAGNYNLVNSAAAATANITAQAVTVQADLISKILGAIDPPLTYRVFGTLAIEDSWTGSLTRDAGETVGSYTIRKGTLNVSDGNLGNNYTITFPITIGSFRIIYATSGICNGDGGHIVLQPINFDGSSVFKQGSTVPAKFRVCDVNGNSIGPLPNGGSIVQTFVVDGVINGTVSPTNEAIVSTTPDTAFRWDPTSKQWIFNISTKNLSANHTYQYAVGLNDGSTIAFQFGLK